MYAHVVFSTKDRADLIDPDIESRLYPFIASTVARIGACAMAINGTENHLHLLLSLSKNHAISQHLNVIKKTSSRWMNEHRVVQTRFAWQTGYGAFSVSRSGVERVRRYIDRQKDHHRAMSFEDELRAMLTLHDVAFDERYVWT